KRGFRFVDRALLLLLIFGVLSYGMQRAAFGYSVLPFTAPLIYFAACAFDLILSDRAVRIVRIAALTMLVLLALRPIPPADSNVGEIQRLRDMERSVPEGRCVYDNSGTAINRPHVRYYWSTDILTRKLMRDELNLELLPDIVKRNCPAMIIDERFYN